MIKLLFFGILLSLQHHLSHLRTSVVNFQLILPSCLKLICQEEFLRQLNIQRHVDLAFYRFLKYFLILLRQGKTMNHVVIPLNDIAKKIIRKYNGGIPDGIHMNDFNKLIKGIAEDAGIDEDIIITKKRGGERKEKTYRKYELIASHTCRRSFCTNEYLKGTPTLLITSQRRVIYSLRPFSTQLSEWQIVGFFFTPYLAHLLY